MADEEDLRAAKAEISQGLANLQRRAGKVPDARAIDAFVEPILAKADKAPPLRPGTPSPTSRPRTVRSGEWFGEEGHSPQIGVRGKSMVSAPLKGETLRLESKVLGQYAISGDTVKPLNGAPDGKRRMQRREAMLRGVTSALLFLEPEWKRRLEAVTFSNLPLAGSARASAYQAIVEDAIRIYGSEGAILEAAYRKLRALFGKQPESALVPKSDAKIFVGGK